MSSSPRTSRGSGSWARSPTARPTGPSTIPDGRAHGAVPGPGARTPPVPVRLAPGIGRDPCVRIGLVGLNGEPPRGDGGRDPPSRPLDSGRRAVPPPPAVPLPVALAAFTKGSAHVNFDDDAESIEEGNHADLVVLDRNLFDAPDATVADAAVEHTIASGKIVYTA